VRRRFLAPNSAADNAAVRHRVLPAAGNVKDQAQQACLRLLRLAEGPLLVPSPVLGEVGYLLQSQVGPQAEVTFLNSFVGDGFCQPTTGTASANCRPGTGTKVSMINRNRTTAEAYSGRGLLHWLPICFPVRQIKIATCP
jgi:hypothetical protein